MTLKADVHAQWLFGCCCCLTSDEYFSILKRKKKLLHIFEYTLLCYIVIHSIHIGFQHFIHRCIDIICFLFCIWFVFTFWYLCAARAYFQAKKEKNKKQKWYIYIKKLQATKWFWCFRNKSTHVSFFFLFSFIYSVAYCCCSSFYRFNLCALIQIDLSLSPYPSLRGFFLFCCCCSVSFIIMAFFCFR